MLRLSPSILIGYLFTTSRGCEALAPTADIRYIRTHKIIFVFGYICLLCSHAVLADQTPSINSKDQWYTLGEGEEYVTDFLLKASAGQAVTINSDKPIVVGFKSNITAEKANAYQSAHKDEGPIKVVQTDAYKTNFSFDSGMYLMLPPIKGKINLSVSNNSNEDWKVMIYVCKLLPKF